jgi:phosphatidylglycerophosphate synthase
MRRYYKVLPSAVSFFRMGLGIIIPVCATKGLWLAAAIMAVVAIASDWFDGWLAVTLNARTRIGAFIDPPCDFVFAAGLVAGAIFTGLITWTLVTWATILFAVTWIPVVTIPRGVAKKIALAINRTYYVMVIFGLTALYCYKALGSDAIFWVIPAVIASALGLYSSSRHHG